MRGRQIRREVEKQYPVLKVILKCVLMSLKVVFHLYPCRGMDVKFQAIPDKIKFGGVSW